MTTLHIENTVHDYESWKAVFDKFDRFRAEQNVRSYRLCRHLDDPHRVTVEMDFDTTEDAIAFRGALEKIWATPQSREQLVAHERPRLLDLVEARTFE